MIKPELLEIIVCPVCKGSLILDRQKKELQCFSNRLAYPIIEGIPVLIKAEARTMDDNNYQERY